MGSGGQNNSTGVTAGKTATPGDAANAADQPTQTDRPLGPEPKSSAADPMKKDGGA